MPSVKSAQEIRRDFLNFFAERGHREVPSGPVFPQDDPTLLFTNAGMNQFKDVFLGTGQREYARAVDTQKCIRVSGKHNDLEEVGVDTYHHTFFEMLGNWSFGDYFKQDAIAWAWELLTGVWKLPKDRLWVTVFAGDASDGLPADEEAERIWRETTDIDPSHILRFDKKDNFWEMGEAGPCGPCSEIHIDRGGPESDPALGADREHGVNAGNERFIELWNLVFMEFNRLDDGSLRPLPARHVDTGMGFERVVSVLQNKQSNYDTDVFTPIFQAIAESTGRPYGGKQSEADVAFRVIADHMRAVSSAFADGALPSNVGRGYVMRRLIRRASRYGRQALGREEPFLYRVVPVVAQTLGGVFPEIAQRIEHIQLLVRSEEEAFAKTLDRGLARFAQLADRVQKEKRETLPGEEAYELYATYGFPQDLVELMARERSLAVDLEGWKEAQAEHREKSRAEGKFQKLLSADELKQIEETLQGKGWEPSTVSTCHDEGERSLEVETRVVWLHTGDEQGQGCRLILEKSPFYPESGGQVGDAGRIQHVDGKFQLEVEDTRKFGNLVVHIGTWSGLIPDSSEKVVAVVDAERRARTRKNHTATHLLHKALKLVLGEHVAQQGSYVGPDRLRFDFSHPRGVEPDDLERIEALVNERVFGNAPVKTTIEDLEAAKARGVVAMFGEKYGERVRVCDVGGWSTELCGGTHVEAAGDIGPFVVLFERAIAAGVRRLEALTGPAAVAHVQEERRLLRAAAQALKSKPAEMLERIEGLRDQLKQAKKAKAQSSGADLGQVFERVRGELCETAGVTHGVFDCPELGGKALGELADRLKSLAPSLVLGLFGRAADKVPFLVVVTGDAAERGLHAGKLAQGLRQHLGGGGGGRPDKAQGQGLSADGVPAALAELEAELARSLGS